ncbi:MAG: tetratricopeptide repeat protein [Bryobacteraceae bacterium]|nr:tetratricopeptide repeat protein [Bryobacteraceae bacterium]
MRRAGVALLLAGGALLAGGFAVTRGGRAWLFAGPVASQASTPTPGADCRALKHRGKNAEAHTCFMKLTVAKDQWSRAEGFWGIGAFKEANDSYKAAVAAQPKNPDVRVRWGRLFLERFNRADAKQLFMEAIKLKPEHGGAYLGAALVGAEGYSSTAVKDAEMALKCDPTLVEAQELLARLALEDNDSKKAIEEADKAIKMSVEAFDAYAIKAAVEMLDDKPADQWFAKITSVNPTYGPGYALAGRIMVLNRRYHEGIAMYRKALEADANYQPARAELGVNLMRMGFEKEAREQLEKAYDAGYHADATVNSLRLIDSYKNFDTFTTPTTIVRLHKKESELLKPYVEGELKRAMATFEEKYKVKVKDPIQVEVYPDHEDFAVRTMGMPGLGALGVTFGHVVAMDSPSGRKPGSFHWASTLWHELSHVYVLTATNHRVPRWFTEGMAVHEETAAAPDWGDRLDPEAIKAITDKKLLPVAELDRGFVRPQYPSQVVVSYFQAGKICDYVKEKWGYSKLLAMMHDFAKLKTTPEVIKGQLGMEPEAFDKEFLAWLDKQVRGTVDGYKEWQKSMKALAASRTMGHDEIIKEGEKAIALYPEFVEGGSAYEQVAEAYTAKGDKDNARKQLERYAEVGGRNPATLVKLASLEMEAGQQQSAVKTYERLMYIYPLGEEAHRKLGELYIASGNKNGAVREFGAAVASKPPDEAGARFNLAKALFSAQRKEEAKEQLLMALELAPGFKPAQKMLLELSR